jgi:DNA-binding NarL/FixJ family response regulator
MGKGLMPTAVESRTIRVVVADERRLIAEALAALIGRMPGFVVTGVIPNGLSLETIAAQHPDLVLVGVAPASHAAYEFVDSLHARDPSIQTVLVADVLEPELISFVLDEGLSGLLLTDAPAAEIAQCLDQVVRGHAVMPAGWQRMLVDDRDDSLRSLSERQLEVLTLLAEGHSYEQIGAQLFISPNTVKFHVRSIYHRLGVRNRMAAARILTEDTGHVGSR